MDTQGQVPGAGTLDETPVLNEPPWHSVPSAFPMASHGKSLLLAMKSSIGFKSYPPVYELARKCPPGLVYSGHSGQTAKD